MKSLWLAVAAAAVLSACASDGALRDTEKLGLYREHAGAPVGSFNYFGRITGWTPLGDSALAVWTKPSEAYLLELYGPCQNLTFTPVIGLTGNMNRVYARFDKVLTDDRGSVSIPCNIREIRPLDVKALKASEKEMREARVQEREASAE